MPITAFDIFQAVLGQNEAPSKPHLESMPCPDTHWQAKVQSVGCWSHMLDCKILHTADTQLHVMPVTMQHPDLTPCPCIREERTKVASSINLYF